MDSVRPLVSIIMPVYNAEIYVEKAITSILFQSYKNIELLAIDDCSTDGSLGVLESFSDSRIKIFNNSMNMGYLKSVNSLFSRCSGDFITFQDADDWSKPDRIEKQIAAFLEDADLKACGTQCDIVLDGRILKKSAYELEWRDLLDGANRGVTALFCGASVMVSRDVVENVGGFDVFFDRIGAEDIDWLLRILSHNKAINLPDSLYCYRQTRGSVSRGISLLPLKYCSSDIALAFFFIRAFSESEVISREIRCHIRRNLLEDYERDPALIYKRAVIEQVLHRNYCDAVYCIKKAIKIGGFRWRILLLLLSLPPIMVANNIAGDDIKRKLVARRRLRRVGRMVSQLNLVRHA